MRQKGPEVGVARAPAALSPYRRLVVYRRQEHFGGLQWLHGCCGMRRQPYIVTVFKAQHETCKSTCAEIGYKWFWQVGLLIVLCVCVVWSGCRRGLGRHCRSSCRSSCGPRLWVRRLGVFCAGGSPESRHGHARPDMQAGLPHNVCGGQ